MHIQKRVVNHDGDDGYAQKASIETTKKSHRNWRRFMNKREIGRSYISTSYEHLANCLTHGCPIIPSFIAAQRLISHAKTPAQYWSSIIYGNALIFLFASSTVFHCSSFHPTYRDTTVRHFLHRVDRAIIYIFICASYTPWLLLRPMETVSGTFAVTVVWIMGILGITYQTLYHERYKWFEICVYVTVGVLPGIAIFNMTDHSGKLELVIGGVGFLSGIFFYKCDGILPFAHAIWHCFVVFGAAVHYYAIYTYLMIPPLAQNEFDSQR